MKTKTLLKSISSMALLLVMILLSTMACKKEIKDPLPPTPLPLPTPEFNDVFKNKPLKMFSDYEIANNLDFPGHVINKLGDDLAGGYIKTGVKIAKGLWKFKKWADPNDSTDFQKYMAVLNQIEGQLTTLQSSVDELGAQLDIDVSEMTNLITQGEMNPYITHIQHVMDSSTHSGFGYFMMEGKNFQAGEIDATQMNIDTAYATQFAYNVFNEAPEYEVTTWSEQIHDLVCPAVGSTSDNSFRAYANLIISQTGDDGLQNDDEAIMNAYLLFESYFMQIINNQFQCMLVWANACNYYDTTGHQANLYWEGTFRQNISTEIEAYLETTDYLALNLMDYRNQSSFQADYEYMPYGLAPERHFRDILARSQFLANLLYDGLGVKIPVMCGSVITPSKYSTTYGHDVDTIGMIINGVRINSAKTVMKSRYPYTYWTLSERSECFPDNNWNTYRFGKASDNNGNEWPSTEQDISLVSHLTSDKKIFDWPWSHIVSPKGKITPLWYNPLNLNEPSTTKIDSTYIQFAFFSGRWNWGYPFPSLSIRYNEYHEKPLIGGTCLGADAPFAIYYRDPYYGQAQYTVTTDSFSDYGYNAIMAFSGNTGEDYFSGDQYSYNVVDWQAVYIKTSGNPVTSDSKIQLWAQNCLTVKADCSFKDQIFMVRVAPKVTTHIGCFEPENPIIHQKHPLNTDANTYFAFGDLDQSKDYELNTGYFINRGEDVLPQTHSPMQVLYTSWMQVVYTGNYPLN